MTKSCATCKWGRFEMTTHKPPRINRNRSGKCEWPIPMPRLPECATGGSQVFKVGIWTDMGFRCATWEPKA